MNTVVSRGWAWPLLPLMVAYGLLVGGAVHYAGATKDARTQYSPLLTMSGTDWGSGTQASQKVQWFAPCVIATYTPTSHGLYRVDVFSGQGAEEKLVRGEPGVPIIVESAFVPASVVITHLDNDTIVLSMHDRQCSQTGPAIDDPVNQLKAMRLMWLATQARHMEEYCKRNCDDGGLDAAFYKREFEFFEAKLIALGCLLCGEHAGLEFSGGDEGKAVQCWRSAPFTIRSNVTMNGSAVSVTFDGGQVVHSGDFK